MAPSLRYILAAGAAALRLAHGLRVGPAQSSPSYNETEAILYAHYARASFCDSCGVKHWTCGDACTGAQVVNGSVHLLGPGHTYQVRGYVAQLPDNGPNGEVRCIVAFRGSSNIWNWIADLNYTGRPWHQDDGTCPGCSMHSGFSGAYDELETEMFAAIQDLGCQTMTVSGHSLGAAVATMAAYRIRAFRKMVADPVYLLAAPRVGNKAFVESFVLAAGSTSPPAWRVINDRDPVPRVPSVGMGFMHFPQEVYYSKAQTKFKVCDPADGEDRECAAKLSLISCFAFAPLHTKYLRLNFARSKMSDICKNGPEERCGGHTSCACDVIVKMGDHTDYKWPIRYSWESVSRVQDPCERELWEHIETKVQMGYVASRCKGVNPVTTCSCHVHGYSWLGANASYQLVTWQTVSTLKNACESELWGEQVSTFGRALSKTSDCTAFKE